LVNWIGTYWLPAAPPPRLVSRLTDRFAVVQAARPVAVVDFYLGTGVGDPAGAALSVGLWLAGVDGGAEDADCPFPDDPQPAATAAAATSDDDTATPRRAATTPRRTRPELVIIPIPFVLARSALRTPETAVSRLLNVAFRPDFLY
jgi:hypothetical protein